MVLLLKSRRIIFIKKDRDFRFQFPLLLQASPLCPREAEVHDSMKSNSPMTSDKVSYSSFGQGPEIQIFPH